VEKRYSVGKDCRFTYYLAKNVLCFCSNKISIIEDIETVCLLSNIFDISTFAPFFNSTDGWSHKVLSGKSSQSVNGGFSGRMTRSLSCPKKYFYFDFPHFCGDSVITLV